MTFLFDKLSNDLRYSFVYLRYLNSIKYNKVMMADEVKFVNLPETKRKVAKNLILLTLY